MPNLETRGMVKESMGTMKRQLIAFLLVVIPACSSSDDNSQGVDPLTTPDGFCRAWAQAACTVAVARACSGNPSATPEACITTQTGACRQRLLSLGLIGPFVLSKSRACVRAVQSAYADLQLTAPERDTVVNLGGDCAGLDNPNLDAGVDSACPGCTVLAAGHACDPSVATEVCEAGNYCGSVKYCINRPPAGQPCCIDPSCSPVIPCMEDSVCRDDGQGQGPLCVARKAAGLPCTQDSECAEGLFCSATPSGLCTSMISLSVNEPICGTLR